MQNPTARADAVGMRLGDPAALKELDRVDGKAFEHFVAAMFERLGYEVAVTEFFD